MNNALDTLFYPLNQGVLDSVPSPFTAAFLNARPHTALKTLGAKTLVLQQYFKPYAAALQDEGYGVSSEIPLSHDGFDTVFVLLPKSMIEGRSLLAQAIKIAKPEALIVCAADNKAGGNRIKKMLQNFGLSDVQDMSKNKARVAWGVQKDCDEKALKYAIFEGKKQSILGGEYQSIPGIFGWDKVDIGSEILLQHLPESLKGKGADFGCGYGYLSRNILQQHAAISELLCIDADYRSMKLCQENLAALETNAKVRFFWEDLTAPLPEHIDLDFIVMNPPFHEGKTADSDIGQAFIKTAYKSLSPGGRLYMVANVQLPYEQILQEKFTSCEKLFEGRGFKMFSAVK